MKSFYVFLAVIFMFSGCSGEKKQAAIPAELAALAQQFKSAEPGAAKLAIAKKLQPVLPTCMRQSASGDLAKIDYGNPTYVLKLPELYALLGQPAEATDQFVSYDLGRGEKANFFLLIEIYDDYVSAARIDVGK
jgi:hypothetical protein